MCDEPDITFNAARSIPRVRTMARHGPAAARRMAWGQQHEMNTQGLAMRIATTSRTGSRMVSGPADLVAPCIAVNCTLLKTERQRQLVFCAAQSCQGRRIAMVKQRVVKA